jgi:tetratricopeptide (TPR) repeat protein
MSAPDPAPRDPVDPRACTAVAALLLLAVAWIYAPVAGHELIPFDDDVYVVHNPILHSETAAELGARAFGEAYGSNWIPLTWLSLAANVATTGFRPGPILVTNLVLHGIASVLLLLALVRMTGALWRSAAVAMIFAVHPLHVESVAWASERKDVLCAAFWMGALWVHAGADEGSRRMRIAGTTALGVAALLAKPMAVTLPFTLLLLDFWPLRRLSTELRLVDGRRLARAVGAQLPLLAAAGAIAILTFVIQEDSGAMKAGAGTPLSIQLENALVALVVYPWKSLWPAGLAFLHPFPIEGVAAWRWLGAGALAGGATAAALFVTPRRWPAVTVGWLWYLGTLLPVSGIVQVGSQAWAERYAYVPQVGLALAFVWGLADLKARARQSRGLTVAVTAIALGWLLALAATAHRQVAVWRDGETLFRHALDVTGENPSASAGLAIAALRDGRSEEAVSRFHRLFGLEAPPERRRAAVVSALARIGRQYLETDPAQAVLYTEGALYLAPGAPRLHGQLATAFALQGRWPDATESAERAARLARDRGEPDLAGRFEQLAAGYRVRRLPVALSR